MASGFTIRHSDANLLGNASAYCCTASGSLRLPHSSAGRCVGGVTYNSCLHSHMKSLFRVQISLHLEAVTLQIRSRNHPSAFACPFVLPSMSCGSAENRHRRKSTFHRSRCSCVGSALPISATTFCCSFHRVSKRTGKRSGFTRRSLNEEVAGLAVELAGAGASVKNSNGSMAIDKLRFSASSLKAFTRGATGLTPFPALASPSDPVPWFAF